MKFSYFLLYFCLLNFSLLHSNVDKIYVSLDYMEAMRTIPCQSIFFLKDPQNTYNDVCSAICNNDLEQLDRFVRDTPEILTLRSSEGFSLLHLSVLYSRKELIEYLIARKIPINLRNNHGHSALHLAVFLKKTDTVKILLAHGASPLITDIDGHTPLWIANVNGYSKILKLLQEKNKNLPIPEETKQLFLSLLPRKKLKLDIRSQEDLLIYTPSRKNKEYSSFWHKYARNFNYKDLSFILDLDFEYNGLDRDNNSLLHLAALYNNTSLLHFLLTMPINIKKNKLGSNPLHIAAEICPIEFITILLNIGCSVHEKNKAGLCPVFHALFSKNSEALSYFLSIGISANTKNTKGQSLVHQAARLGLENSLKILIHEYQASYDNADHQGKTPLYFAAEKGFTDIVAFLLKEGADVNKRSLQKMSPLHIAVSNRNIGTVNFLLSRKICDLNLKDRFGRTAYDIAKEKKFFELEEIFELNRKNY